MNCFTCFLLVVLVTALGTEAATECPRLYTRSQWGAAAPRHVTKFPSKPFVMIIRDTGKNCNSRATCNARVKQVQNDDMKRKELDDLRCNFVIGSDGNVYEGSGWKVSVLGSSALALCVLGDNFETKEPPQLQKDTIKAFIECPDTKKNMRNNFIVQVIRESTPISRNPGQLMYDFVKTLPRYHQIG